MSEPMSEGPVPLFTDGLAGYITSESRVYMDTANDRIERANDRIAALKEDRDRLRAEVERYRGALKMIEEEAGGAAWIYARQALGLEKGPFSPEPAQLAFLRGAAVPDYASGEFLDEALDEVERLRAEVERLTAENKSLEEIATEAWASAEPESTYGSFPGGDPRNFTPDEECCTPVEIAKWKAACAEWDAGVGVDAGPACSTFGDGSVWLGTGFGVGTYRWTSEPAQ